MYEDLVKELDSSDERVNNCMSHDDPSTDSTSIKMVISDNL